MFKPVIGLEIHAQLMTKTKAFCSCSADHFETEPNKNICPVCTGHPGALPVLNEKAIELAVRAGLAINGEINLYSKFDRKNYFYPDLTKGYQITQYFKPIITNGKLNVMGKDVRINRIHMEEDTGKMVHLGEEIHSSKESLIDYNRAGVPLIEIVTEPDIESAEQARAFMEKLRDILRYAEISTGDMEKGALRCDANVSVKNLETGEWSNKVEVKNINSFKFVEKAIKYEIERITEEMKNGNEIIQETRRWDSVKNATFSMRKKEGEADYRYFPEADLPPLIITKEFIENVKKTLPELPDEKSKRFVKEYKIPEYDAELLSSNKELSNYYEECARKVKDGKFVSNWIMTEVLRIMKEKNDNIFNLKLKPDHYLELKTLIESGKISTKIAKEIFPEMYDTGKMPSEIVKEKGLEQIDDDSMLYDLVEKLISENPKNVEKYKSGKTNIAGFFVGQVMKQTKGKANPAKLNNIVKELLDKQ
ncbi:aspartyl/glutamyl-tRNA(Asn/Gln) amidotransferase subunit B [Tepiditoga spiralis]|uniref:Aspartyl/glutamyl-tRNA(Asn/Gln) amidotransferase subunit B n=1 Tax=Tepiditoga spiralis TaxID=2108365 RepID=A0A7G1G8G3_9BACT|nr:Asp-tRNA(Asn)/Glu-tRNA(Gln) amidotransferase subunit GatB [Tepiditoga spiralis]BBE31203.1 aspartyl/glutamyl-tRNA(Asn/Gln) amidotransferase subunit B [Tepiditoga spiralis]